MESLLTPQMVEIYVATRPDCISDATCALLKEAQEQWGRRIFLELGLQTPNYHTLVSMHRGHTLAEFLDAVLRLHQAGLGVVAHVILDLPGDTMLDAIESAKILSTLGVEGVKMHSLYIARGSALEEEYLAGKISPPSAEEYAKRAAAFLAHLAPEMVVHRLAGRIPEALCAADSGESWWKTRDRILAHLSEAGLWQGAQCDYLNGAALRAAGWE